MTQTCRDCDKILTIVAGAAFGVAFNELVGALEADPNSGHDQLVSLEVSFGVVVTVLIAATTGYISWQSARRVLVAFTASGVPMIVGSLRRNQERRAAYDKRYQD